MWNLFSLLLLVSHVVVLLVCLPLVSLVRDEVVGREEGFVAS